MKTKAMMTVNASVGTNGRVDINAEDESFRLLWSRSASEELALSLLFARCRPLLHFSVLLTPSCLVVKGSSMSTAPASKLNEACFNVQTSFEFQVYIGEVAIIKA